VRSGPDPDSSRSQPGGPLGRRGVLDLTLPGLGQRSRVHGQQLENEPGQVDIDHQPAQIPVDHRGALHGVGEALRAGGILTQTVPPAVQADRDLYQVGARRVSVILGQRLQSRIEPHEHNRPPRD
jgi:hypothetical protein